MRLNDIHVAKKPLVRVSAKEVDDLAKRLWITFPSDYREYITKFGEGTLGGSLIRIYPPWRIERELADWRRRVNKYWFWDAGRDVLPKDRALECILIGDTTNGDEIIFHPTRPQTIFILPRDSEDIFEIRGDLLAAIEWTCTSGKLVEPFDDRDFEPYDSREESDEEAADNEATDPDGESLDEIIELAKRWAKRHAAKKQAMKELRAQSPKGTKSELIHESIVIEGDTSLDVGYSIAWKITDARGKEVGVFRWTMNEDSSSAAFGPTK
jgi:hypothetical protein